MNTKTCGSIVLTTTAVALIITLTLENDAFHWLAGSNPSIINTEPLAMDEFSKVASSSVFPAYVKHTLPTADMADVAAEVAIERRQQALPPSEPLKPKQGNTDDSANNHVTPMLVSVIDADVFRGTFEQSSDAPTVHTHLQSFNTLLSTVAFKRTAWQDTSFSSTDFENKPLAAEPFLVMIDPGHGGTDPGSTGHNGLLEKDLTLDIARRVGLFLTELDDIDVQLTRQDDYGLSRQARVDAIKKSGADMVISLHFNHLPQTDINLVESYYAGPQNIEKSQAAQHRHAKGDLHRTGSDHADKDYGFTEGSARLARTLQQHVFSEVNYDSDIAHNAGVKQETFFVLTRSFTPAALIEISCLSHADEADRLVDYEYRNRLAAALVDGIRNYHDSIKRDPIKVKGDLGA